MGKEKSLTHEDVKKAVKKWLRSRYPDKLVKTRKGADLMVYDEVKDYVQVECKAEWGESYKGLGQALVYHVKNGLIPTYLAVPYDYSKLDIIKQVIKVLNLPISLIIVQQNGEVEVLKKENLRTSV